MTSVTATATVAPARRGARLRRRFARRPIAVVGLFGVIIVVISAISSRRSAR